MEKYENYQQNSPVNFRKISLGQFGYIMDPNQDHSEIIDLDREPGYLHPVEVRSGKDPEDGIEIDFYDEMESDKLITIRIQFRKGNTSIGWLANHDGTLLKKRYIKGEEELEQEYKSGNNLPF